jgi:hypothetical protein
MSVFASESDIRIIQPCSCRLSVTIPKICKLESPGQQIKVMQCKGKDYKAEYMTLRLSILGYVYWLEHHMSNISTFNILAI